MKWMKEFFISLLSDEFGVSMEVFKMMKEYSENLPMCPEAYDLVEILDKVVIVENRAFLKG